MYVSNPSMLLSLIPWYMVYLCSSFPNMSDVYMLSSAMSPFSFITGVPVNPKYIAFGNSFFMSWCIVPICDLWHSSTINTILFLLISSKSLLLISLSFFILLIFCIDVTISVSDVLLLFSLLISCFVSSVSCTSMFMSA